MKCPDSLSLAACRDWLADQDAFFSDGWTQDHTLLLLVLLFGLPLIYVLGELGLRVLSSRTPKP